MTESTSEAESISEAIAKFNIQLDYSGTKAESTSKATVKYPTLYTCRDYYDLHKARQMQDGLPKDLPKEEQERLEVMTYSDPIKYIIYQKNQDILKSYRAFQQAIENQANLLHQNYDKAMERVSKILEGANQRPEVKVAYDSHEKIRQDIYKAYAENVATCYGEIDENGNPLEESSPLERMADLLYSNMTNKNQATEATT